MARLSGADRLDRPLNALDRHLALIGFMGAGKTTIGRQVAHSIGRAFVDVDEGIELEFEQTIGELFSDVGEETFRGLEWVQTTHAFRTWPAPLVVALGGGAPTSVGVREVLAREEALTVLLDVDVDTAWERARGTERPLAGEEKEFRRLHEERQPLYREVADAVVPSGDVDGVILAAAGIHHELGALDGLAELVPGDGPVALVADPTVAGIYGPRAQEALGARLQQTIDVPRGEEAKQLDVARRVWSELRLDRGGTIVALGGGTTTDLAGFVAATYLRGIPWVAVPTTLVGQVDAAIGGKTGIDLPEGKNLVGAFHWPARVMIDEALLETLPERERRQGQAELLKTELLAERSLDVRGAAAFKAALCLRDPRDQGQRNVLNLGHTFAHALEAAADFDLPHGEAVALGLLAALRLSNRDTTRVEEELEPRPVAVDSERAWQALLRDKKRAGDAIRVVVLADDGPRVEERPAEEVRRELVRLIG
ncbi:MAG TPA: bifunctional shikimate kinase/3-dehydroquinate synthase [Gaiellaceae bacterium]|nr:bifunctional shikimate kinase/3-dehydroquinate synthase [Gaiellaceae bacterium]